MVGGTVLRGKHRYKILRPRSWSRLAMGSQLSAHMTSEGTQRLPARIQGPRARHSRAVFRSRLDGQVLSDSSSAFWRPLVSSRMGTAISWARNPALEICWSVWSSVNRKIGLRISLGSSIACAGSGCKICHYSGLARILHNTHTLYMCRSTMVTCCLFPYMSRRRLL